MLTTNLPVAKTLIKYNYSSDENDEEGADWYWVYWAKSWSWNDENAIDFRWSDVIKEDEEDIVLANFIESLQKQTDEKIKKLDDCGIIPNEKKN